MADFATSHVLHREPIAGDSGAFARPAVRTFSLSNAKTFAAPQEIAARRQKFSVARRTMLFFGDLALVNITYHLALGIRFGTFMPLTGAPANAAAWSVYRELELYLSAVWIVIAVLQGLYKERKSTPGVEKSRTLTS